MEATHHTGASLATSLLSCTDWLISFDHARQLPGKLTDHRKHLERRLDCDKTGDGNISPRR
jgi:hypothetical protein